MSEPIKLVTVAGVAEWLGWEPITITTYIRRYAPSPTPTPQHDAVIRPGRHGDFDIAWHDTELSRQKWLDWAKSRPGRGAGGGRPRTKTKDA